jgi:hypothetical protein
MIFLGMFAHILEIGEDFLRKCAALFQNAGMREENISINLTQITHSPTIGHFD